MKQFRIDLVYHCPPEKFWDTLWDNDVRRERELKGAGTLAFSVLESRWEGDTYHQVVQMEEVVDAPRAVQKIFGKTQKIEETARWKKGSDTAHIRYKPSILTDKVTLEGTLTAGPADGGHTRVVMDMQMTAAVFLIGGVIEGLISKALPKRQAKDVAYFNAHQSG